MKKSTLVISTLVALGVIATGGAWFTGKQVEQRYQELITQANQKLGVLGVYGIHAQLKDVQIERGVLSSDLKYTLQIDAQNQPLVLQGYDTLYHGPFPLNRLTQGKLLPVLASLKSELIPTNEQAKALFNQKTALNLQADIAYSGKSSGKVLINPMKSPAGEFETSEITFEGEFNQYGKNQGKVDLIKIANEAGVAFHIQGVKFKQDYKNSNYAYLPNGTGEAEIQSVKLISPHQENFEYNNVKLQSNEKINGERVEASAVLSSDIVLQNPQHKADLGKFAFDFELNLDAKTINTLTGQLSKGLNVEANNDAIAQFIDDVVQKSPKVKINSLVFENDKGKTETKLVVNLLPFESNNVKDIAQAVKLFQQFAFDFELDLDFAKEFLTQFNTFSLPSKEAAAQEAEKLVNELKFYAKSTEFVQTDEKKIQVKLAVNGGKITSNGKEFSDRELQSILFMLILSMGGLVY